MFKKVALSPFTGLVLMLASPALNAMASSGWWVFAIGATWSLGALFFENWQLKEASKPRLSLVFEPKHGAPYFEDQYRGGRSWMRIYRVGIKNSGDSVRNVRVLLRAFTPRTTGVELKYPLAVMGGDGAIADVHRGDQPMTFFDLFKQGWGTVEATNQDYANFPQFALLAEYHPTLSRKVPMYKFALEIDGESAEAPMYFIYKCDNRGVYTLEIDDFPK
jgi:hypothetical protein